MAETKSNPRTAVGLADDIDEALARVNAISTTVCLAATNETPGVGELGIEDFAALRAIVGDLLDDVRVAVSELRALAEVTPS